MFDFVRKHNKLMQIALFVLIVPSFVLFGIEGYSRFQDQGETVAEVNGKKITQSQWDTAHKTETERLRSRMPGLDAQTLDSPAAKYISLERLVREQTRMAAAQKLHLTVGEQRIAQEMLQNPVLAELRGPDGRVDMARYRQLLAAQNMSPEMFEAGIRNELSMRQVLQGIAATGLVTSAVSEPALNTYFDKREIQYTLFTPADYANQVEPTQADIERYYKANTRRFEAPATADIQYVVLDAQTLENNINLTDAQLKAYYEQQVPTQLAKDEQRQARHILIKSAKTDKPEQRKQATAKAQEVLALAKKTPADFAKLASQYSQDTGSAESGGDLGWFGRGAMVKVFEDAAFTMNKGEVSNLVESEYGYHIIYLVDIKRPEQRSFEAMKPEIERDLRRQQAQAAFSQAFEAFSNGVYEQSDSLEPVAKRLGLTIQTAQGVNAEPAPGATGALASKAFLKAVFADDVVQNKRNTPAVELNPKQLAAARIVRYAPAHTRSLDDVKDEVKQQVALEQGVKLAQKAGTEKLAAWKAKPETANLPPAIVVSRELPLGKMPAAVLEAALRADNSAAPTLAGVDLGNAGYAIVRVNKPLPQANQHVITPQDRREYEQVWTAAEGAAYDRWLAKEVKATIKVAKPADVK